MTGGQVALIGFLYQMIGLLALRVWATDSDAVNATELETLLALIRDGELYHEKNDIDGLVRRIGLDRPDALVLLQFKFSHHPERYPVTPGVLAKICQSFLREVQQWPTEQRNITSYRVITNRPVSETLRPVMDKPPGERENEEFNTPELSRMLQDIEILEDLDFSQWTEALKHFTDEYGVEEHEFEAGVSRLIGDLARHASVSQAPPIREEDLIKIFCGYERPRKLTVSAIRSQTANDWDWLKDKLGLQGPPVRRQLLAKATEMLTRHAIIIFCGLGGVGKSIAAWHLLYSMLQGTDDATGSITAFLPAWKVHQHPLSWVVGEWSGMPEYRRTEPMEQALNRIRIANPAALPVLCLTLDGLDEQRETLPKEASIQEIVEWFCQRELALRKQQQDTGEIERPEASLIITCRDIKTVLALLHGNLSQKIKDSLPDPIPFKEYSTKELLEAVEQVLLPHFTRFRQTLEPEYFSDAPGMEGREVPPVHPETLKALHHPAMWYALQQLNAEQQNRLLDGDPQALDSLAQHFLDWFYYKVKQRQSSWRETHIAYALGAVALEAARTRRGEYPYTVWKKVMRQGSGLEGVQVTDLYDEALSAGVILEDAAEMTWHWRHPFIGRYLVQMAQKKGLSHG